MGLYDRDYTRYEEEGRGQGFHVADPRTVTGWLVVLCVAVAVADMMSGPEPNFPGLNKISYLLALHSNDLQQPLHWLRFLTFGFVHEPLNRSISHLLFNMLVLWSFGRVIEGLLGPREYLRLYLALVISGGVLSCAYRQALGFAPAPVLGASGAITGLFTIYALKFPHNKVFLFGVAPVPAWLLAILFVLLDVSRAFGSKEAGPQVAYEVHLAGALVGLLYERLGWRLSNWPAWPSGWRMPRLGSRPRLQVHHPDASDADPDDDMAAPSFTQAELKLTEEGERLLVKINAHGINSLTRAEQATLEKYSRLMRTRRK